MSSRKSGGLTALRLLSWSLALPVGYAVVQWILRDAPAADIELVAHRGGALEAPESTTAAYHNALEQGYTALELDIQMTSDGELVVFHDDTVDRTTDGSGPLAEKTLAEMKALDAGSWFGAEWRGERVLTLRELIDIAKTGANGGARLMLEIKSPHLYPGIEAKMIRTLEETGYMDRVVIMSFDGKSLEEVRRLRPQLPLLYLIGVPGMRPPEPPAGAGILGPNWRGLITNPSWVKMAHQNGQLVYVWTVNDEWVMRYLRSIGVDGFISDRPALLLEILGEDL